jgi:hypothetical protein
MTPLQVVGTIFGIIVSIFTILFGLAKVGQYVLRSFHNEHTKPALAAVETAIHDNTTATENVAKALSQEKNANAATFERMGQIIEDHEERITALEPQPSPAAMRVVRKPRRI